MRVALLALAIVATGCWRYQTVQKPRGGGDRGMPDATATRNGKSGLGRKAVYGKEDPATLVARDRTRCLVTEKRYRETAIGELVWCSWK